MEKFQRTGESERNTPPKVTYTGFGLLGMLGISNITNDQVKKELSQKLDMLGGDIDLVLTKLLDSGEELPWKALNYSFSQRDSQ